MRGQLGDHQAVFGQHACDVIAIGLACRRLLQIEQAMIVGRNLHADKAEQSGPPGDVGERVEWRRVPRVLGKEDARTLECFHIFNSVSTAQALPLPAWDSGISAL